MTSDALQIRSANAADAGVIAFLAAELGYPLGRDTVMERLAAFMADERQRVLVAEQNGTVLGWLQVSDSVALESGRRAEIVGLVVSAAARRQGIGRALVRAAEQWAQERGIDRLVVRSNVARTESHAFYPALGFRATKTQTVYHKILDRG